MSYEVVSIKKERELEVKKTGRKILKFLKLLILIVLGIVIVFTTVRAIGRAINSDIVNIGLHFILKNVRPYAASCSES